MLTLLKTMLQHHLPNDTKNVVLLSVLKSATFLSMVTALKLIPSRSSYVDIAEWF